jgi:hypothetical protein
MVRRFIRLTGLIPDRMGTNHKDLQTTLKVYAKTGRRAELEARQKAHELMFDLASVSIVTVTEEAKLPEDVSANEPAAWTG